MSYSQTPVRLAYEMRCREDTASRLQIALPKTLWTPLGDLRLSTKHKLLCRCACGAERQVRVRELLAGKTYCCRACSTRRRLLSLPAEVRTARAVVASRQAAVVNSARAKANPLKQQFGDAAYLIVRRIGVGARQRCRNAKTVEFVNYGGRGIEFKFPTVRDFVEWVLVNLGPRPSPKHSLDRIDNNRHYEPGNLRWATRIEQARNKRAYKRSPAGDRIRALQALRTDLSYETLRQWIHQGATDDEILQRRKHASPRV